MFKQTLAALLFAATIPAFAATAFKAEVSGSGQPVILIPGLASSGEVWKETAAHLCGPRQRERRRDGPARRYPSCRAE